MKNNSKHKAKYFKAKKVRQHNFFYQFKGSMCIYSNHHSFFHSQAKVISKVINPSVNAATGRDPTQYRDISSLTVTSLLSFLIAGSKERTLSKQNQACAAGPFHKRACFLPAS